MRQLMDLRPETARVKQANGSEVQLSIGEIVTGYNEVDEALITGASLPVPKNAGDSVTGGAINGTGLLERTSSHSNGRIDSMQLFSTRPGR